MKRLAAVVAMVVLIGLSACSTDESGSGADTERDEAVVRIVDDVIVPSYAEVAATAAASDDAITALCAAPSAEAITRARADLRTAWGAWERTDTFEIGPAVDRRSNTYVAYRVAPARVDALLAQTVPADADAARNRTASNQRGYGAIDHLLLVDDPALYSGPRCVYLASLSALIAEESGALAEAWAGEAREETLSMASSDVIDDLVNMQQSFLEGAARTYEDGTEPTPSEAFEIPHAVRGMRDVYLAGLNSLLGDELATTVMTEIDAVLNTPVNEAGEPIEALRATVATEVVSALDVTVGFSENDGDS